MDTRLLKGKPVADAICQETAAKVSDLAARGVPPLLGVVRMGERPDDLAYERGLVKRAAALGVKVDVRALPLAAPQEELIGVLSEMGGDAAIHGILLFRPLPPQIDMREVKEVLAAEKDVDGLGAASSASIFDRSLRGYLPCTAEAVVEMLRCHEIPLAGARAVILGRSLVVGRALALLLMDLNATVTVCHSRTRAIESVAQEGDILVCAMGRAKLVGHSYVKPGAVVIDVGINDDGSGGVCGDVDMESVTGVASAVTPTPGGMGVVTNAILLRNVVRACENSLSAS